MSSPTNHWKLGLFVVAGLVIAACTVFFLGSRSLKKEGVKYNTYFDESVQGLEVGSPIKFRGVSVGTISDINVAPDHRHVLVVSELTVRDLGDLGLKVGDGKKAKIRIPADLRVQLVSQGITGVKFLQMDFFNVKDNPPPNLPFPVPDNYIPAAVSTMKSLEDAVVRAVNRIPEVAEGLLQMIVQINRMLLEVEGKKLPENASKTLAHVDEVLVSLQASLFQLNTAKLSSKAQDALTNLNDTISRANAILARVDGDKGLVASTQRATNAVGDIASNSKGLSHELEQTLRDIQQAASAFQRIADALERDPDMLLKGRGKTK